MIFSNNLSKNLKKPVAKLSFSDVAGLKKEIPYNECLFAVIFGILFLRNSTKQRSLPLISLCSK